jgi:phosphatidate cytidylyltransferase
VLRSRLITATILVAVAIVCVFWLPSWLAALLFAVPWTLGAWEWARLVPGSSGFSYAYAAVFLFLALASGSWFTADGAQQVAVAACCWWLLAFVGVSRYPWPVPRLFVSAGGLLALLPSWFLLAYIHQSAAVGPSLVMSVLAIVWAADVGAYFTGRRFGRIKLAPAVSPNKTWEGVIGGLACAALVAAVAGVWLGFNALVWSAAGFATALVSIVGDLTVSMFKRRVGLKDSGHLLPGHGGILDRIDSLTSAVPVFALSLFLSGGLS